MDRDQMEAAAEAVLFTSGKAVSSDDLAKSLDVTADEARSFMEEMSGRWNKRSGGTEIIRLGDGWQMRTKRDFYPQLIRLEKGLQKPRLTDVLLETLAIIAYRQPVTKSEIERIRGVNSDHAVSRLVEYDLVTELGRAKQPGRPILFGTTEEFLRAFDLSGTEDLPEVPSSKEEVFLQEAEEESEKIDK